VLAAQQSGLALLLEHAIEHSPFHRQRLGGIDARRFTVADLQSLPVMTKADMMANLDVVFTDRRLQRSVVERALAQTAAEPVPILDRYTAIASRGARVSAGCSCTTRLHGSDSSFR
jgi:hypothetical protein